MLSQQEILSGGVALIGFGEAAQAFVTGWQLGDPASVAVYDVKTDAAASRDAMHARYAAAGLAGMPDPAAALAGRQTVFCLVTADEAAAAARVAAAHLAPGALWLDCNSCAPATKRASAAVIEAAGAAYVDVAVMAPVHPRMHRVPLLVGGPHRERAAERLRAFGMCPETCGETVGEASSVKMIRSVMIKGIEALTAECFLAAGRAGVLDKVLASLAASDPGTDWPVRGAYNLERMMVHGVRRAAEMREVALTVADLGLEPGMSAAAAAWQDRVAGTGVPAGEDDLGQRVRSLLERL